MLVSTIELYWRTRRAGALGLTGVEGVGFDWRAIIERKDRIVQEGSKGTKASLEKKGITVLEGEARFTSPQELRVGDRSATAGRIVIATGSAPARPSIEGADRGVSSDEFLDLKELPKRLLIVGGGTIGMELGFCAARAGSKVTVLQRGANVLPGADDEMRRALVDIGREAGIEFHTEVEVKRVAPDRTVEASVKGEARGFQADVVLFAAGRPPNVGALALERAGIELERGGVKVNEYLQSPAAPHVYAVGDAAGGHPQHSPAAWYEGQIAAHNALKGNERKVDFSLLPKNVFTIPALAQVGLTEQEAQKRGLNVAVNRAWMKNNPAADVREEKEGLVKVVYDKDADRVLGVHALGAHAEDLIQIAAAAMRGNLKRAEIGAMHYVFPTLGGAVFDAMAGW